jgi:ribosomal protein S18 acetylase RimI-like enzyme
MSIQIRPMATNERDRVAGLVAEAFAEREPLALHFGVTKNEMFQFCRPLLEAERDLFSVVAIDEKQDRVAGALICESFSCPEPAWEPDVLQRLEPILSFLQDLDHLFFSQCSIHPNEVFHDFMLATATEYCGRGIAAGLVRESNALARSKGFKYCLAETTGPISRHIFVEKLGYREQLVLKYEQPDGPFAGFGPSRFCSLVVKEL